MEKGELVSGILEGAKDDRVGQSNSQLISCSREVFSERLLVCSGKAQIGFWSRIRSQATQFGEKYLWLRHRT